MIGDFWVPYESVVLKDRAQIAIAHAGHILPRVFNVVANVSKVVFFGLACALSFGQLDLLNHEFKYACGRTLANLGGVLTAVLGILFPVTAGDVQGILEDKLAGATFGPARAGHAAAREARAAGQNKGNFLAFAQSI